MDAMLRVADPDAQGLPWFSPLQPQLAGLQNCAPAERARREHAVRYSCCLQLQYRRRMPDHKSTLNSI